MNSSHQARSHALIIDRPLYERKLVIRNSSQLDDQAYMDSVRGTGEMYNRYVPRQSTQMLPQISRSSKSKEGVGTDSAKSTIPAADTEDKRFDSLVMSRPAPTRESRQDVVNISNMSGASYTNQQDFLPEGNNLPSRMSHKNKTASLKRKKNQIILMPHISITVKDKQSGKTRN